MGGTSLKPDEIEIISLIQNLLSKKSKNTLSKQESGHRQGPGQGHEPRHGHEPHEPGSQHDSSRLSSLSRKIDWPGFVEDIPPSFLPLLDAWSRQARQGDNILLPAYLPRIPAVAKRRIRERIAILAGRNLLIKACLKDVAVIFRREKIDFILLKGFFLESRVYDGKPRFFDDLDILLHEGDLGRARRALLSSGYEMLSAADDETSRIIRQEILIEPSSRCPVELHTNVCDSYAPFAISNQLLFRRSRAVSIDGIKVRVLDDEMALVHLCIHHIYNHSLSSAKMVQYSYEISEFIRRLDRPGEPGKSGSVAGWDSFVRLVRTAKAGAAVYESLIYADRLFPIAMDPGVLSTIRKGASKKEMLIFRTSLWLMQLGSFCHNQYRNGVYWLMKLLLCDSNRKRAELIRYASLSAKERRNSMRCDA